MSKRVAGLHLTPGTAKPRIVLLSDGRRQLSSAAAVLRALHSVGGDEFHDQLAKYLDKVVEKHAPPAKAMRGPRTDSRAKQQPRGDA